MAAVKRQEDVVNLMRNGSGEERMPAEWTDLCGNVLQNHLNGAARASEHAGHYVGT